MGSLRSTGILLLIILLQVWNSEGVQGQEEISEVEAAHKTTSQQLLLEKVFAKMDESQRKFLDGMHKTGFLKSIGGPCGQAILCQTLADNGSDTKFKTIEKRAALFVQMLETGEAKNLEENLRQVIESAKKGDCSVFQCKDE